MTILLARITGELSVHFEALAAEAAMEGHRNIYRLGQEWARDASVFRPLLAAFQSGDLVGVGALTVEPTHAKEPAMRMRRFYVARQVRRSGVGRTLAAGLVQEAFNRVSLVTVHAGNPQAALFWEAIGFSPVAGHAWSHQLQAPLHPAGDRKVGEVFERRSPAV